MSPGVSHRPRHCSTGTPCACRRSCGLGRGADPRDVLARHRERGIVELAIRFATRDHRGDVRADPNSIPLLMHVCAQSPADGCPRDDTSRRAAQTGYSMTQRYRLDWALLQQGWARDALVTVGDDGIVNRIDAGEASAAAAVPGSGQDPCPVRRVSGFVVPGMANAHSHAFQRGMAGNAEYRLSARDSFWTWRRAMYALANRIEPEDLEVLATQLFIEMLKSGYTSRRRIPLPAPPGRGGELYAQAERAVGGRRRRRGRVGHRAYLPADPLPVAAISARSRSRPEQAALCARDRAVPAGGRATRWQRDAARGSAGRRTGAAFHSLRAVPLPALREAARGSARASTPACRCTSMSPNRPRKSRACARHTGRRPIELLLDTGLVDAHWCLVHATHATAAELQRHRRIAAHRCASPSAPRRIWATDSSTRPDS